MMSDSLQSTMELIYLTESKRVQLCDENYVSLNQLADGVVVVTLFCLLYLLVVRIS